MSYTSKGHGLHAQHSDVTRVKVGGLDSSGQCHAVIPLKGGIQKASRWFAGLAVNPGFRFSAE